MPVVTYQNMLLCGCLTFSIAASSLLNLATRPVEGLSPSHRGNGVSYAVGCVCVCLCGTLVYWG